MYSWYSWRPCRKQSQSISGSLFCFPTSFHYPHLSQVCPAYSFYFLSLQVWQHAPVTCSSGQLRIKKLRHEGHARNKTSISFLIYSQQRQNYRRGFSHLSRYWLSFDIPALYYDFVSHHIYMRVNTRKQRLKNQQYKLLNIFGETWRT